MSTTPYARDNIIFDLEYTARLMRNYGLHKTAWEIEVLLLERAKKEYDDKRVKEGYLNAIEQLDDVLLGLIKERPHTLADLLKEVSPRIDQLTDGSPYRLVRRRLQGLRERGIITYQQMKWTTA